MSLLNKAVRREDVFLYGADIYFRILPVSAPHC